MKYSTSAKLHSRTDSQGKRKVYVTYTFDKQTTPFATSYSVRETDWDSKRKLAVVTAPEAAFINAKIQQVQADILATAAKLATPTHELVKRIYGEQAYQQSRNEFLDLAIAVGEDWQIQDAEERLTKEQQQLQARKKAFSAARVQHGLESKEDQVLNEDKQQLRDLFRTFAGTGEVLPGQFLPNGKPRRDQGTIKRYKTVSYNGMVSMWNIVNDFAECTGYPLTLQNINNNFYDQFGDFILFNRKVKDANGKWLDGENSYDNYFGSLIKRLKTFLKWCASDGGVTINPQVNSLTFKSVEEVNEVIILSDSHYRMLADFREDPACRPTWVKHIDITLFQAHIGLRHSDMKQATWRVEGEWVDGKDRRTIVGSTKKNKSTYKVPVYLNQEFTLNILEKYNFDFNEPSEASRKKGAKSLINILLLNNTMKEVLKALDEKHDIFKQKIKLYKTKRGEQYLLRNEDQDRDTDYFYQWELHTSHDNRRAFITRMFRKKFNEKVIATMVGTRSLGELRKYQQVAEEDFFQD